MTRLSIRTLMVYVVIAAIGLAAVTSPNEFWAGLMTLIVLSAVVAAILIALLSQSKRRAWWAGFAFFCGCYLMSSNAPGWSQLTTTRALKYVILLASPTPVKVAEVPAEHFRTPGGDLDQAAMESFARHIGIGSPLYDPTNDAIVVIKQPDSRWRTLLPGTVNQAEFIRVGHAFLALLVGLVGGTAIFLLGRLVAIGLTAAGLVMSGIGGRRSESQSHVWRT